VAINSFFFIRYRLWKSTRLALFKAVRRSTSRLGDGSPIKFWRISRISNVGFNSFSFFHVYLRLSDSLPSSFFRPLAATPGLSSLGRLDDTLTTFPLLRNIDFRTRFNFMVTFFWSLQGVAYLNMSVPPQVQTDGEEFNGWKSWREKVLWLIEVISKTNNL
jgi:hypothetical protein